MRDTPAQQTRRALLVVLALLCLAGALYLSWNK
jgi:hypothetical protein